MKKFFLYILGLPRVPVLWLIKVYQKTLSPDHSWISAMFPYGYCKFQPSCSEYGYGVIRKYGLLRGVPLTFWRILRCNPFNRGGEDPVR